ncbi:Conserved_hypothetical protein [Hexamita inflata]|uniref:Leucine Rich Repeat family protein n=1 Tax=Hexamita inflata TaxID=28002 RepID=A0AA86RAA9_9EUKA|nr:Conserved hypothetical protein [Hexamita inflata]
MLKPPKQPGPLHTVFSITASESKPNTGKNQKSRQVQSELSYHKNDMKSQMRIPQLLQGKITPQILHELNGSDQPIGDFLQGGKRIDASGLKIQRLEDFEWADIDVQSLNLSGNKLFLDQLLNFSIKELDLSDNGITDQILTDFFHSLVQKHQEKTKPVSKFNQTKEPNQSTIEVESNVPEPESHQQVRTSIENDIQITHFSPEQDIALQPQVDLAVSVVQVDEPKPVEVKEIKPVEPVTVQKQEPPKQVAQISLQQQLEKKYNEGKDRSEPPREQKKMFDMTLINLDQTDLTRQKSIPEIQQVEQRPHSGLGTGRSKSRPNSGVKQPPVQIQVIGVEIQKENAPSQLVPSPAPIPRSASEQDRGLSGKSLRGIPNESKDFSSSQSQRVIPQQEINFDQLKQDISQISSTVLFKSLVKLDLSHNQFQSPELIGLLISLFPNLTELGLSSNKLNLKQVDLIQNHQIRKLQFCNTKVTKDELLIISELFPSTEYLQLQNIDAEMLVVQYLRLLPLLKTIDLTDSMQFRDLDMIKAFARNCDFNYLEEIILVNTLEKNPKTLSKQEPALYLHLDQNRNVLNDQYQVSAQKIQTQFFQSHQIIKITLLDRPQLQGTRINVSQLSILKQNKTSRSVSQILDYVPKHLQRPKSERRKFVMEEDGFFEAFLRQQEGLYQGNNAITTPIHDYLGTIHEKMKDSTGQVKDTNTDESNFYLTSIDAQNTENENLISEQIFQRILSQIDAVVGPTIEKELLQYPLDFVGLNMLRKSEKSTTKQLYWALRQVMENPPSMTLDMKDEEIMRCLFEENE